ncbi:MAG: hypothetical protein H6581_18530 [Bacteroidia bacterium]|nr:hypothetical protein [Bacteroidia bacterium]
MLHNKTYRYWVGIPLLALLLLFACKSNTSKVNLSKNDKRARYYYDQYYVKFAVREIDGLNEVPLDSLPWRNGINNLPQNGQVAYWFLNDMEVGLSSPHIRAEYIYRRNPWCSTSDSLFMWLQAQFVDSDRGGEITTPPEYLDTYSGKKAHYMDLRTPEYKENDSITRPRRYMAWSYLEQNDYFVGLVYTAFDSVRFNRGKVLFRELVSTYEEPANTAPEGH